MPEEQYSTIPGGEGEPVLVGAGPADLRTVSTSINTTPNLGNNTPSYPGGLPMPQPGDPNLNNPSPPPPPPPGETDPWENTLTPVPIDEPLSAGAPPVAPDLVRRITLPQDGVAGGRVRSGELITWATATGSRPRYRVVWTHLTQSQRDLLQAFIVQDLEGRRYAMDVQIDGLVYGGVGVAPLRPLEPVREEFRGVRRRPGGAAGDFEGVYSLEVECEQLL
jgi:hypothetical protein